MTILFWDLLTFRCLKKSKHHASCKCFFRNKKNCKHGGVCCQKSDKSLDRSGQSAGNSKGLVRFENDFNIFPIIFISKVVSNLCKIFCGITLNSIINKHACFEYLAMYLSKHAHLLWSSEYLAPETYSDMSHDLLWRKNITNFSGVLK